MLHHLYRLWNCYALDEYSLRFVQDSPNEFYNAEMTLGELVGNFTNYFREGTTVTQAEFQAEINRLALYIVYLFIGKFVLSYVAMVSIGIYS